MRANLQTLPEATKTKAENDACFCYRPVYVWAMAKKVLFIDDDKHWREVVELGLTAAGYDVLVAQDASEGMFKADGADLGLIILDLDLAGESGLSLMKYLKRNHPGVPILLFTGMEHDDQAIRTMLSQGADEYLRKDSLDQLLVSVGVYLR